MPFGFWVLGNRLDDETKALIAGESQMPFGFWVLGNIHTPKLGYKVINNSLKCLSAFGFWGTLIMSASILPADCHVSNAFRLLGSGELTNAEIETMWMMPSLKCLSAFGFWGTAKSEAKAKAKKAVSNAFRLLGSGEL